ncbi:MAG: hypothetical protein N3E46_11175 [Gemmataceae bacterium]|nr:hypothetical protein [Gemmataceae bacterium]
MASGWNLLAGRDASLFYPAAALWPHLIPISRSGFTPQIQAKTFL